MGQLMILLLWAALLGAGLTAPSQSKLVNSQKSKDVPPVSITALPDGVAITAGEPLRQAVATWNIYVTLEKPTPSADLFTKVAALEATLHNVASIDWTFKANMDAYRAKQQYMMSSLRSLAASRQKRGLLDIGG